MSTEFGIKVKSKNDRTMIDRNGILQTWVDSVADNLDENHPVYLRFYLPEETMSVQELSLAIQTERFRSYTKETVQSDPVSLPDDTTHSHDVDSLSISFVDPGLYSWDLLTQDVHDEYGQHPYEEVSIDYWNFNGHTHQLQGDISPGGSHPHGVEPHDHGLIFGINIHGSSPGSIDVEIEVPDNGWQSVSYSDPDDIDLLPYIDQDNLHGWYTLRLSTDRLSRVVASYMVQTLTAIDLTGEEE